MWTSLRGCILGGQALQRDQNQTVGQMRTVWNTFQLENGLTGTAQLHADSYVRNQNVR